MKVCEVCRARFRDEATECPLDGGTLRPLPDPLLGRHVGGRYRVERKLGAGGMGTVYLAVHDVLGRRVALKFLAERLCADRTNRTRFLREARAANRINHEHIIDITDFGETDDGLVYLVMEYLEGVPLNEEIARGRLPPRRALKIALQAAQALARAHELDVIHRDIKPDNIYLLSAYDDDFIKILDFGLAQMKGELKLTATGMVVGTPEYIAPEQARGAPITHAADLYALGCVIFEMLTGRLPFEGQTPELILKHMREPPPAPSSLVPAVSKRIDELVLRLLAKEPEARFATAYDLAEDIQKVLDAEGARRRTPKRTKPLEDGTLTPRTAVTEDAWSERVQIFSALVGRAHPRGDAPSWLVPAIEQLATKIREMKRLRHELDEMASAVTRQEDDIREVRLRIGRALDELGRDESRTLRHVEQTRERYEGARHRLIELEKPLLRAWGAIPPMPVTGPSLDRELVDALREAGQLASIWLEAERALAAQERELQQHEREAEDLRFQIAQLKGRLGTLNAEGDFDTDGLRQRTLALDAELRTVVDEVVKGAEPVYKHFMAFPDLRDEVLGQARPRHVSRAPR